MLNKKRDAWEQRQAGQGAEMMQIKMKLLDKDQGGGGEHEERVDEGVMQVLNKVKEKELSEEQGNQGKKARVGLAARETRAA